MEDTEEYFSLKWSDFRSSFSEGFHDFLEEEAMVDVTLAAEGEYVQAHKLVLSVCSPYFKDLFKINPCKHPIVILKDVDVRDIYYMLEFMYKGEVGVKQEDLSSFLKVGEMLKIKGLAGEKFEESESFLAENLDSNMARVRKKINRDLDLEVKKENTECESSNEESNQEVNKNGKRRLLTKSVSLKKFKSDKCDESSVSVFEDKKSDDVSDEEDNNEVIKFSKEKKFKIGESSKTKESEFQCCCKNKSETSSSKSKKKNSANEKTDSDESAGSQSDQTEQTEEMQGHISPVVMSRAPRAFVWDYFLKETHQAVCLNCGKTFKGQRPNTICEQHLKRRHPEFYKILLEKKIRRAELHTSPMAMGLGVPHEQEPPSVMRPEGAGQG